jgi:polyisoprenoid-binding protein YceI
MQRTPRSHLAPAAALAAGLVLTALLVAPAAGAAEQVLSLDPDASQVTFFVEATGHDVHGNLYLTDGEVRFDPATGEATGRIAIDATRAETGNKSRDKKMRNSVLETESYPLFVFVPDRFEGEVADHGTTEVKLHGKMTIHGAEHEMTLPATVEWDEDGAVSAVSDFEVPYVEWGMENPGFLFLHVAPTVSVTVNAQGRVNGNGAMETAAASQAMNGAARGAH